MTPRDIIKANLTRTGQPRPGLRFGEGRRNDFIGGGPGAPRGYVQKRWIEGDYEYYDDIWGNIWHRMAAKDACKGGEVITPIIADWDDFDRFTPPVFDRETAAERFRAGFAKDQGDHFRLAGLPGWIFAQARYIRRMDNYLMDMALYPENLHRLHAILADIYETLILAAGDAKADAIFFCEDMGTQRGLLFSPAMWNEFFRDLYMRLFGLAHDLGIAVIMHSCGQNREILEPLLKAGVNCFQFDQPAVYDFDDLGALLRQYRAALFSPVDIQKVLPTGNRQLIEAEVDRMINAFGGGLIFTSYGDLTGIGVKPEWDAWAYDKIISRCDLG